MTEVIDEKRISHTDGRHLLGELTHYRTYAATKLNKKKESRKEVIDRVKQMHQTKFPWYRDRIEDVFWECYSGRVVQSQRSSQFGGEAIFRSNCRIYNCSYASLTTWKDFADLFYLLMNGCGVGYSVQSEHVSQLPEIRSYEGSFFVIEDSKEGWSDGLIAVLSNPQVEIDVSQVRPKGASISSGGTASGPETLVEMYEKVKTILFLAEGRKLRPIECFDIMCHVADVVVVGGVRRAATIALFDEWSVSMLTSKSGDWWRTNPQRMRANISAVIRRDDFELENKLQRILGMTFGSGSGEPGVFLTNDTNIGSNPCMEISLQNRSFCNLSEINLSECQNEEDFLSAVYSATAIGTLQASYTDFHYLHPDWKKNCEKEALLGVSITGQAMNQELLTEELLQKGAKLAVKTNQEWARMLDINPAARITTTKPSGNTSAWLGTTSGIHAAHAPYYLRRVRVDRKDAFGKYLIGEFGEYPPETGNFIESDKFNKETIVVTVPINMTGAIMRDEETALELLERTKKVYNNWILPGHIYGSNTHNVSLTVSYKPHEQEEITDWMIRNSDSWTGIALLPYDGGNYIQAPFEEITEYEFYDWLEKIPQDIDFGEILFDDHIDTRLGELACMSGSCEIV